MPQVLKGLLATLGLLFVLSVAGFAQTDDSAFDFETFDKLALRAEGVVDTGLASTKSLEILRADLVGFRVRALASQENWDKQVAGIEQQIAALGEAPAEAGQEAEKIALRREKLTQKLQDTRAPLIIEKEAFLRASGLIDDIDVIIRVRRTDALFNLNASPLNLTLWPKAFVGFKHRVTQITTKARVHSSSNLVSQLRRNNLPAIVILIAIGLLLIFPARSWISRHLTVAGSKQLSTIGNVKRLLFSFGIFIVPMLGLVFLLAAIELTDVFSVRGELLLEAIPMMGVSIFGANWLARNLPQQKLGSDDNADEMASLISSTRRVILPLGIVVSISYLLVGLSNGADWSDDIKSVLRFPLVILLGLGLFMCGRNLSKFRHVLSLKTHAKSIPERMATIFMWACYLAGVFGPLLSAVGYSNAGAILVFSMVKTLALTGAMFIIYSILVHFIQNFSIASDQTEGDQPDGGLYKIGLAFVLLCISVPALALIWGASFTDLGDMWYKANKGVSLGEARISVSDFLIFILIFFAGYSVTKLLQSVLRTIVLPSTKIESGAQNALVTGFGYVGILIAVLVAVTTTGLDLSSLAIVAGALSVGIGFGLQTIVSNFVSGIILLVERPVKIGDWVEIGAYSGTVRKVSVRSTSVETFDGATVILPNADLIAGTVTNWTHGNVRGRVKVPVGVAYGTDPELVQKVLLAIAVDHPMVLKLPAPKVVFMGFGADSMDFQLRGILRDVNYVLGTMSDMNFEIVKRFNENNIVIPFAQREVTIKNAQDFFPKVAKPARKPRAKPRTKPKAQG